MTKGFLQILFQIAKNYAIVGHFSESGLIDLDERIVQVRLKDSHNEGRGQTLSSFLYNTME